MRPLAVAEHPSDRPAIARYAAAFVGGALGAVVIYSRLWPLFIGESNWRLVVPDSRFGPDVMLGLGVLAIGTPSFALAMFLRGSERHVPPNFAWRACVVGVQYVILVLGCMCVLQALFEQAVIPTALAVLVDLLAIATLPFSLVSAALGMHQSDAT